MTNFFIFCYNFEFNSSKLIFVLGLLKCILGYNCLFFIIRQTFSIDANPDEASK